MEPSQQSSAPSMASDPETMLAEERRRLAQYVRDLYDSGAKMYTRDMFRDLDWELAKEPMPDTVMLRSMSGIYKRVKICKEEEMLQTVIPRFSLIQDLVYEAEQGRTRADPVIDGEDLEDEDVKRALATLPINIGYWTREDPNFSLPPPIIDEQLRAAWDAAEQAWLRSDAHRELTKILRDQARVPATVQRVICFGLGSIEQRSGPWENDVCPATQHAAALTVAAILGERRAGGQPLPVIVQDPAYEAAELRLLATQGFEVVGGERGMAAFALVDDDSFIISCSPDVPVKQIVADLARPAGMMWNRVMAPEEERMEWEVFEMDGTMVHCAPWSTDEDSARTRALVEGYENYDFPAGHEHFYEIEFYIRKD